MRSNVSFNSYFSHLHPLSEERATTSSSSSGSCMFAPYSGTLGSLDPKQATDQDLCPFTIWLVFCPSLQSPLHWKHGTCTRSHIDYEFLGFPGVSGYFIMNSRHNFGTLCKNSPAHSQYLLLRWLCSGSLRWLCFWEECQAADRTRVSYRASLGRRCAFPGS